MTRKKGKRETDALLERRAVLIDEIVCNEDLLIEILLCVPVKSLIKFKCVSRSWRTLISDPKFCYNHSAKNPKVVSTILYYDCGKLMSLSLHGHRSSPNLSISGEKTYLEHSSNGLILFSWGYPRQEYSVCNLTTQESTIVPLPDSTYRKYQFSCLAFDPAKSPYYKIILILYPRDSGFYQIDIYFSETKSWKRVDLPVTENGIFPLIQKAYWNGSIHWMSANDIHLEFDVDKEKLVETPLPKKPTLLSPFEIHFFGECCGNLLLVQYRTRTILGFRILEMKRGTRHWIVKQRVNLRPILDIYPDPYKYKFHVMSVVKGSRENDCVIVLATWSKYLSYDLRTKTVEVLGDLSSKQFRSIAYDGSRFSYCTEQFFESLSPI